MSDGPNRLAGFLYGLLPVVIALAVAVVLVIIGGKAVQGYDMKQEARSLQQRVDQLKKENRQLTKELDYYRSDEYIEKVAREELGLSKPGEVSVALLLPEDRRSSSLVPTPTPAPTPPPAGTPAPTWQKWLSNFVERE